MKAVFRDYRTGNDQPLSLPAHPFGFKTTQEMQAAYPGSSIESACSTPVTGLLVPEKDHAGPAAELDSKRKSQGSQRPMGPRHGGAERAERRGGIRQVHLKWMETKEGPRKRGRRQACSRSDADRIFNPRQAVLDGRHQEHAGIRENSKYEDPNFSCTIGLRAGRAFRSMTPGQRCEQMAARRRQNDGRVDSSGQAIVSNSDRAGRRKLSPEIAAGRALYDPYLRHQRRRRQHGLGSSNHQKAASNGAEDRHPGEPEIRRTRRNTFQAAKEF